MGLTVPNLDQKAKGGADDRLEKDKYMHCKVRLDWTNLEPITFHIW